MELPEKIESNFVAYLQAFLAALNPAAPDYFTADLIHPGETDFDKTTQVLQVVCQSADNEDPSFSGNFWHPLQIELRTPLTLLTDAEKADPANVAQLDKHKAIAAILSDALLADDLIAQINAAAQSQADANLQAFAAIGFTDRKPIRDQNDAYIMSGFELRLYACSNAAAA